QILVEERPAGEIPLQIVRQAVLPEVLDGLRALLLLEMHAVRVARVAAVAGLPGHYGIRLELIEPGAHEAVARLDLVIEEGKRQLAVHRLDPQRQPAQLGGQRVYVDAVDAPLDDGASEDRLEPRLEVVVLRPRRQKLLAEALLGNAVAV